MNRRAKAVLLAVFLSATVRSARATGEPVNGFPNWAERVIHEWMNRARVQPSLEMTNCGSNCSGDGSCYMPQPPLYWNEMVNRSARFHSAEMLQQGYFAHDSACTLVSNISSLYPASCNGAATCACVGGTKTCSTVCTAWDARVQMFGASAGGEIIASSSDPNSAFYQWLYEPYTTPDPTCVYVQGPPTNGHRYLILTSQGSVGAGVESGGAAVGDFTGLSGTGKVPSGSHYPRGLASTIDAWANWFDNAGPLDASVIVDGTSIPMMLERGTATNGAWHAVLTGYTSGCHRYDFLFHDSSNTAVRYPTTGTFGIGDSTCADWLPSATRGDVTGDGKADVVWRRDLTGENYLWTMNGTGLSAATPLPQLADTNWKIVGQGDFDGDGKSDLLWRNSSTGADYIWFMDGATLKSAQPLLTVPDANFKVVAVGDFDGDGKADIFWRNSATGSDYVWLMSGASVLASSAVTAVSDLNWVVVGTGDFDGDAKYDILWRNLSTGANYLWTMNGTTVSSQIGIPAVTDGNYFVVAVGDFTGDGKADIFWRNILTGANYLWQMNGATLTAATAVTAVTDINWKVAGFGDFNNDGKTDLFWRHVITGDTYVWLMTGATLSGSAGVATVSDPNWKIVAPK
jgi:hypothetical protein